MLTQGDIDLMKANRKELEQLRTTPVTLTRRTVTGENPYTKEPIFTEAIETVNAIVEGFTGEVGGEQLIVNGVVIQEGDVNVTFDISVNLNGITQLEHDGVAYVLFSVQERGIGTPNRYECVARKVK